MYIAHDCPVCKRDIVNHLASPSLTCNCGYSEDQDTFWRLHHLETYLANLEREIERRFPCHYIRVISNTIDIAIGWHALGRLDERDACIKSILEQQRYLIDAFGVGFCDFGTITRKINKFHELHKKSLADPLWHDESLKHEPYMQTIDEAFVALPQALKAACQ